MVLLSTASPFRANVASPAGGSQKIRPPSILHISTSAKDKRMAENDEHDDGEHPYSSNTLHHSTCMLLLM